MKLSHNIDTKKGYEMARKPRIHFPGAFYHVMLRGNGGQKIFFSPEDQTRLYLLFQEGVGKYGHSIHAFCLMQNHIHLVIQVAEIPLAKIIQNISFRFTRHINTTQERSGHLFQGRYKAILVDADNYLLQLVRYIHNNPVRAELVKQCEDFQWSSHNAYCGSEFIPWLTTNFVLSQLADNISDARASYMDLVSLIEPEEQLLEFQHGTHEGRLLGDDLFAEEALAKTEENFQKQPSLEQILQAVCSEYEIKPATLAEPGKHRENAEARALAALLVLNTDNLTLTSLAAIFRRELSGLSQAARRMQARLDVDKEMKARMDKIRESL
jgi:REP element-mobilizing transposase RayT